MSDRKAETRTRPYGAGRNEKPISPEVTDAEVGLCIHCGGEIRIRNPMGTCDHLKYPEYCPICQRIKKAIQQERERHKKWLDGKVKEIDDRIKFCEKYEQKCRNRGILSSLITVSEWHHMIKAFEEVLKILKGDG